MATTRLHCRDFNLLASVPARHDVGPEVVLTSDMLDDVVKPTKLHGPPLEPVSNVLLESIVGRKYVRRVGVITIQSESFRTKQHILQLLANLQGVTGKRREGAQI